VGIHRLKRPCLHSHNCFWLACFKNMMHNMWNNSH
jgi:hypothetical protein